MKQNPSNAATSEVRISDFYYIIFRHKYKILTCSVLGFAFAAAAYKFAPPDYASEAKLFIRYISEGRALTPTGPTTTSKSPDQRGETIMDSEREMITSWDLAKQVAVAVGPELLLGPTAANANVVVAAASLIKANLAVEAPPRSSVIRLVFRHPNPAIVQNVLTEYISGYLRAHRETHRAVGIAGDFLAKETEQFRSRLAKTEEELRQARNRSGVISLDDTKKAHIDQISAIRQQIFTGQASLAEHATMLKEIQARSGNQAPPSAVNLPDSIPAEYADSYRDLSTRLGLLTRIEQELRTQFLPEHERVKDVRAQIAQTELNKRDLERKFPRLTQLGTDTLLGQRPAGDSQTESDRVAAIESKLHVLSLQEKELRAEIAAVDQAEISINELRRKKDLEEANYRYYAASLEQARIDEALGAGRVSNISQIQNPSPPVRDYTAFSKLIALLGCGGIVFGLGWALLDELVIDRSVKSGGDIKRLMNPALFLSVPHLAMGDQQSTSKDPLKPLTAAAPSAETENSEHGKPRLIEPYVETLRDRLIGYFKGQNIGHKPKLVGVTGVGSGTGVSTVSTGLARSLSEIGDGNVLLVDMSHGQESARHFIRGRTVCDLDQVLTASDTAQVGGNLFVAAEGTGHETLSRNLPQRFSKLAPRLKTSEFDYVIFDLPAVSPISITARVAAFMDMVIVVAQAEKTDRDVLHHATALLAETNAPLGVVLNHTRSYVPGSLHQQFASGV
jgi:succinoglycan biosynthesis transport protein ExoP